jgi:hypothetical protein
MSIFDKWLSESSGIYIVPNWLDKAIQTKNPKLTVALADSRIYKTKPLDKILDTMPMAEKINTEVN